MQQSRRVRGAARRGPQSRSLPPRPGLGTRRPRTGPARARRPHATEVGIDLEPVGEPSAFCGVLTPEEASAALGVDAHGREQQRHRLLVGLRLRHQRHQPAGRARRRRLRARRQGDLPRWRRGRRGWSARAGSPPRVSPCSWTWATGCCSPSSCSGHPADGIDVRAALTGLATLAAATTGRCAHPDRGPGALIDGRPCAPGAHPGRRRATPRWSWTCTRRRDLVDRRSRRSGPGGEHRGARGARGRARQDHR